MAKISILSSDINTQVPIYNGYRYAFVNNLCTNYTGTLKSSHIASGQRTTLLQIIKQIRISITDLESAKTLPLKKVLNIPAPYIFFLDDLQSP